MSTREIAYSIFEQLTEEELEGFVALFRNLHPPKKNDNTERMAAFERMKTMCREIPNLNDEKELAEYREKKYRK